MTRFKKHLGTGAEIEVEGEKYIIKPLTTDQAPLFLRLMALSDGESGLDLTKLNESNSKLVADLLNHSLQKSFPEEWKEDQEETKTFGMKYMQIIFPAVLEANLPEGEESKSSLDELKEKVKATQ